MINPSGVYGRLALGSNLEQGERPQQAVPATVWFGTTVNELNAFSLVGCTLAPRFDLRHFRLADRQQLQEPFPQDCDLIAQLTLDSKHSI